MFALAEKQPGFAKVFFYLEQEVMKPRYEIHSLTMSGNHRLPAAAVDEGQPDLAARALFSATEMVNVLGFDTRLRPDSVPQASIAEYIQPLPSAIC